MNVKAILAAKGGEVISIEPTADPTAAARLLGARRIGAVVIRGARRAPRRHIVRARHRARDFRAPRR